MNSNTIDPRIESSWKEALASEFQQDYFHSLKEFLLQEKTKYVIYPPGDRIFAAFEHTPFGDVKVVIIGQDPYHGKGQAHGLCFSVPQGITKPPSLVNIFKEIRDELGHPIPESGTLEKWARQGVLLLNATLTVRANSPGSHQNRGWEQFTDAVIKKLSEERSGLVFILWGNFAIAKKELIDQTKHYVLTAAHPSPFSAQRGFFGCGHFARTNEILRNQNKAEIDWSID
ncbi:MAG TPA: uracil-DNA glycosylase [Bacteroidales bacterium]|nr:uracil-DNA glycosylase [Bacteroidales bacterium]